MNEVEEEGKNGKRTSANVKKAQSIPKRRERVKYASFFEENGDYVILAIGTLVANAIALSFLIENPIEFLINHIGSIIQIIIGIVISFIGTYIILTYRKRGKIYFGLILVVVGTILILSGLGLLLISW